MSGLPALPHRTPLPSQSWDRTQASRLSAPPGLPQQVPLLPPHPTKNPGAWASSPWCSNLPAPSRMPENSGIQSHCSTPLDAAPLPKNPGVRASIPPPVPPQAPTPFPSCLHSTLKDSRHVRSQLPPTLFPENPGAQAPRQSERGWGQVGTQAWPPTTHLSWRELSLELPDNWNTSRARLPVPPSSSSSSSQSLEKLP